MYMLNGFLSLWILLLIYVEAGRRQKENVSEIGFINEANELTDIYPEDELADGPLEDQCANVNLYDHPLYETIARGRENDYYGTQNELQTSYDTGVSDQTHGIEDSSSEPYATLVGSESRSPDAALVDPTRRRRRSQRRSDDSNSLRRAFRRILNHHDRYEIPAIRVRNAFDADEVVQAYREREREMMAREIRRAQRQGVARRVVGSRGNRVMHDTQEEPREQHQ